jgi:mRNA interferase RelE/StbE
MGSDAVDDLKGYRKEITMILALIVAQARKGPLIKPDGYGEPLLGPLFGFTKIKPKALSLPIVYRPVKLPDGLVRMEIIAIEPKNREEVYELATRRVAEFKAEMLQRSITK